MQESTKENKYPLMGHGIIVDNLIALRCQLREGNEIFGAIHEEAFFLGISNEGEMELYCSICKHFHTYFMGDEGLIHIRTE
jgi:hypothetical protein